MIVGLAGLVAWLARREKRQRRLKEHYEEQFGQNFAYRRTVVIESAPGTAWGEKDEGEVEDGERTLRGSTRDGGRVRGGEGDEGGVGISG